MCVRLLRSLIELDLREDLGESGIIQAGEREVRWSVAAGFRRLAVRNDCAQGFQIPLSETVNGCLFVDRAAENPIHAQCPAGNNAYDIDQMTPFAQWTKRRAEGFRSCVEAERSILRSSRIQLA